MENLASFFISIVTLANTALPGANTLKILEMSPLSPASQSVLSENDEAGTEDVKRNLQKVREKRRERLDELKNRRQEASEKRQERREELKGRLSEFSDQRKAKITENIDENISKLNQKWVDHFEKTLGRLSELLAKIESRNEKAKDNGKDVSSVMEALTDAEAAISAAQEAIDVQANKTYTVTITSETGIGQDVKTTINGFHNDIKTTKESVDEAKRAVKKAFEALKMVLGREKSNEEGQ